MDRSDAIPPPNPKSQDRPRGSLSSDVNLRSANGSLGATSSGAVDSGYERFVNFQLFLILMLMTVMMLIAAIKIIYVALKDIWAAMVWCGVFCQFIQRSFSFCFLFLRLCYVHFMKWLDCAFSIIIER